MLEESVGLTLKTKLSATKIEEMLERSCTLKYTVTYGGIDVQGDGTQKLVHIKFDDRADRDRFQRVFQALARLPRAARPA